MTSGLGKFLLLLLLFGTALPDDAKGGAPQSGDTPLRRATPWTTSTIRGTPDPPPPYRTERVFPNLAFTSPVFITRFPAPDRLLVGELRGRMHSFREDPLAHEPDLFLDLRAVHPQLSAVYGFAFDPGFHENRAVYVCFVLHDGENGTRVSRFRVRQDRPLRCDPESEETLITWRGGGHNGGCLQFGPDGDLYISTGDGTGPFPPDGLETGQDNRDLLAAILRIDPRRGSGDRPYSIPADNPFVAVEDARPEIWAYGFRNPWKMSFDPLTGDLWVGDVGWELWEMVYRVERGGNYGWSVTEGRQPVHPDRARDLAPILPPVVDHSHTEARSITGGRVYRGTRLPDLDGAYVYADYETGRIWGLRCDGKKVSWHAELATAPLKIVAFGAGHSGELYILDHVGGTVHRLAARTATDEHLAFPRRLSDTGLFASVDAHEPAAGVVPYVINAAPWADHAEAYRLIGLPGSSQIHRDRRPTAPWTFPADSVLVKTLELELQAGNPSSRRRIETQVLHHTGSEWRGYSYAWNEDQSDATLVGAAGMDRTFTVVDPAAPGGERRQAWRYFGRSECIVCHHSFNGYVLGCNVLQLNGDVARRGEGRTTTSGGEKRNQLEVLEDLGLFAERLRERDKLPRLPSLSDLATAAAPEAATAAAAVSSSSLDARARAYLHVNCSHCHQRHGGGTSWMELLYDIPLEKTNTVARRPSQGTFGIEAAAILSPTRPDHSLLYYRMATLGPGRMPHMGSRVVDEDGLALIRDWIEQLPGTPLESTVRLDAVHPGFIERLRACDASSSPLVDELVEPLLRSTSGALSLLRSIEQGALPDAVERRVIERGATHSNLNVRGLFVRFLPAVRRTEALGEAIAPERILGLDGDALRGRKLFQDNDSLRCRSCHTVDGSLGSVGPDLSLVGMRLARRELLRSLAEPSYAVDPRYRAYLVLARDGSTYTGILTERTATEIALRDAQNRCVRLAVEEVLSLTPQPGSLMPERLLAGVSAPEVADLIAYLGSLR